MICGGPGRGRTCGPLIKSSDPPPSEPAHDELCVGQIEESATMIGMEARSFASSGSTVVAELLLDGPWKEEGGRQMIAQNSEGFSALITA